MTYEEACKALNGCKHLYLETFGHGDRDSQFRMEIVEARLQAIQEVPPGSDAIAKIMGPGAPIEPDADGAYFTIVFNGYFAISVINESYAEGDEERSSAMPTKDKPQLYEQYEQSHFKDYVSAVTFAKAASPVPMKHFEIGCLNHVINIVCQNDPVITVSTLGKVLAARSR